MGINKKCLMEKRMDPYEKQREILDTSAFYYIETRISIQWNY